MVQLVSKTELYPLICSKIWLTTSNNQAQMYFGLSLEECKELAWEFALKNNLAIPDSRTNVKKAGKQWWSWFKQRYRLSIYGFNIQAFKEYFSNLSKVLDKHRITADCIRDGTGQDFLDPTRPVNFKIIAGWLAGRPVFSQKIFVHCSMYLIENFQRGAWVRC